MTILASPLRLVISAHRLTGRGRRPFQVKTFAQRLPSTELNSDRLALTSPRPDLAMPGTTSVETFAQWHGNPGDSPGTIRLKQPQPNQAFVSQYWNNNPIRHRFSSVGGSASEPINRFFPFANKPLPG